MTKRFAVIGDPVSHSLSPLMHQGWIADHGIDATYEAFLLRTDDTVAAIRGLTQFAGMNVTVPHKEAAAQAADRRQGVVANVLRRESDGSISAFNTDGEGFLDSLDESVPRWRSSAKNALVLGSGGAAREIARVLARSTEDYQGRLSGVQRVTLANRTYSRAVEAANRIAGVQAERWENLVGAFSQADLIVNATTLGSGGEDQIHWPVDACGADAIVVDIVYRPLETELLRSARERGLQTADGLGMLIHQGARSFELWFGVKPDTAKARDRLIAALA